MGYVVYYVSYIPNLYQPTWEIPCLSETFREGLINLLIDNLKTS